MLGQAAQATISYLKLPQGNSCFPDVLNDSGCEMDEDSGNALFISKKQLNMNSPISKGKDKEEAAEAISPGGHIVKQRARSRPVSAELLKFYEPPKLPIKVCLFLVRTSKCVLISFVQSL